MENQSIVVLFEYNKEKNVFPVNVGTSFKAMVDSCTTKWPELIDRIASFRYDAGGIENCCLNSDGDITGMLVLATKMGESMIVARVSKSPAGADTGVPKKASYQGKCNQPSDVVHVPDTNSNGDPLQCGDDNEYPEYDVCPRNKEKVLLSKDWKDLITGVGQVFKGGAAEFRDCLVRYATFMGFAYNYQQNNKDRVYAICTKKWDNNACNWFVRANTVRGKDGYFEIRDCDLNHQCGNMYGFSESSRLAAKMIADLVIRQVKSDPAFSGASCKQFLEDYYGIKISYMKAWRAVQDAREIIYGSFSDSFNQMNWYCAALMKTNPGSHIVLERNKDTGKFERCFIALNASIKGFPYCRPMLFIDGTHMKDRWDGTILSATGKDGNNGLFPVAFAMVKSESTDTWKWFLEQLRDNVLHPQPIHYMSDRNAGLLSAMPQVFEEPLHFYCMVHLYKNLKALYGSGWHENYRKKMVGQLKEVAHAPTLRLFNEKMCTFKEAGGSIGAAWIDAIDPKKWAVAHASGVLRYGEMTSNAAESFNNWILDARSLPITHMVDSIRRGIMKWFVARRDEAKSWTSILTPDLQRNWNLSMDIARSWGVLKCSEHKYEVFSIPNAVVRMDTKQCSCYQWQVLGFPCAHAIAVMREHYRHVRGIVDVAYFSATYANAYEHEIHHIPGSERFEIGTQDNQDSIIAPDMTAKQGRKKKKRIPSYGEFPQKKPWKCIKCNKTRRHDPLTCADAN